MNLRTLLSRRNVEPDEKTDFRPDDPGGMSPFAQLRRLAAYRAKDISTAENIADCPEALDALREYTYRKIFTGTSHDEFLALPADHVDWAIAVHETESTYFQNRRNSEKRN